MRQKNEFIGIRLSPEQKSALEHQARQEGKDISSYIRELLPKVEKSPQLWERIER